MDVVYGNCEEIAVIPTPQFRIGGFEWVPFSEIIEFSTGGLLEVYWAQNFVMTASARLFTSTKSRAMKKAVKELLCYRLPIY